MPPIKSLFLGILAALFALFFEFSFSLFFPENRQAYFFTQFSVFLVISALIEEIIKYAIIYKTTSSFEKKSTIIFNGLLIGLGFSLAEFLLNYYNGTTLASVPFYFFLGIFFVHIITSVLAAYSISRKQNKCVTAVIVLILNSAIHVLYNLAVIYWT